MVVLRLATGGWSSCERAYTTRDMDALYLRPPAAVPPSPRIRPIRTRSVPLLPSYRRKLTGRRTGAQRASPVVQLNVGGQLFTTSMNTLRKHADSRLVELVAGQHGRCFIDRDGSHFAAILEFLRSERLPTRDVPEVHREAVYYNIKPLIKLLEESPQMFGELVGRQQFLSRVPHYKENIEVLIRIARAEAIAARHSTIMICVLHTDEDLGSYEEAVSSLEAHKESVVRFGPWKGVPSVDDLLDCVKMDIRSRGYEVGVEPHVAPKSFLSRRYDYFYKLTFTWW